MALNIEIEEYKKTASKEDFLKLLQPSDISTIIKNWVTKNRSLELIPGTDDLTGCKRVYLLFNEGRHEVASAFFSEQDALREFPEIEKLIPPPYLPDNQSEADAQYDNLVDSYLGENYHEDLGERVTSLENAVKVAIGLILSGSGETGFRTISEGLVEDSNNPDELIANYLWVHTARSCAEMLNSICMDFYVSLQPER